MLKLKNKFIFLITGFILFIIVLQITVTSVFSHVDTHTYAILIEGTANLNNNNLRINKREKLAVGDVIITGNKSLLAIEWGEGSVTRLGENSKLIIRETEVAEDYSHIQLGAALLSGKAWSKIVSMLSDDSYFRMYFNDIEAGVRGTTFDIDLTKEVIFVSDHEVSVKNGGGNEYLIGANKAFSFQTFSFIDLQEYLGKIRDKAWEEINKSLDRELLKKQKENAIKTLQEGKVYITILEIFFPYYRVLHELHFGTDFKLVKREVSRLSTKKKEKLHDTIFTEYQKINFIEYDDDLYMRKELYKKTLMLLSTSEKEKERLIKYTLYDIENILGSGDYKLLDTPLAFLEEHKSSFEKLNGGTGGLFDMSVLPSELREVFTKRFSLFDDVFKIKVDTIDIKERLNNGLDSIYNIFNK